VLPVEFLQFDFFQKRHHLYSKNVVAINSHVIKAYLKIKLVMCIRGIRGRGKILKFPGQQTGNLSFRMLLAAGDFSL